MNPSTRAPDRPSGLPVAARARRPWLSDLALDLRAARARMYVRIVGSSREPAWIIVDALLPAVGMCAFVLLYRASARRARSRPWR